MLRLGRLLLVIGAIGLVPPVWARETTRPQRPNIVWFNVDDMSPHFGCYGETAIETPHVDRLAREGVRFTRAFITAPVCSPSRSALITGCYQTSIGAQNHRSGRGALKIPLPQPVVPIPQLLKEAGYYTCIGGPLVTGQALGKTDYNFEWSPSIYDGNDWSGRRPDQPFFMQVQLHGGKYRGEAANPAWQARVQRELGSRTSIDRAYLPPYYPRDPVLLQDWADYLDTVRFTDKQVGDVIERLEREGLLDSTVLIFFTDHGISHARGKQFLYDEGLRIPLVMRGPGIEAGRVRNDLVEHIDIAATTLGLAGLPVPGWMQGRDLLGAASPRRDAVFAARDRCDETIDQIRSVRTDRFKYIRNGRPERPMLQSNDYKDFKAIVRRLRELHAAGQLTALQDQLLFAPRRPLEELYDLVADPFELHNLAGDPTHADTLASLRRRLELWQQQTNDRGREPESMAMYESDMAVYLADIARNAPARLANFTRSLEQNRAQAREGR